MNILFIVIAALIVACHTLAALFDGIACRVLTVISILLHPAALVPMLLLKLPLEAVALFFLSSALYYTAVSIIIDRIRNGGSRSGGDDA